MILQGIVIVLNKSAKSAIMIVCYWSFNNRKFVDWILMPPIKRFSFAYSNSIRFWLVVNSKSGLNATYALLPLIEIDIIARKTIS